MNEVGASPGGLTNPFSNGEPPLEQISNSNEKEELFAEELELCKRIDLFFTAMKLLQRAVNRKEDIS